MGGYSGTSDLDLKKVGNLDFWDGGVFWKGDGEKKKTYFTEKLT